jgi:S1-C subfamily serine protease
MNSFVRTAIGVLVGVLVGAVLVVGYFQFQPIAAAMAPASSAAPSAVAPAASPKLVNAASDEVVVNVYQQVSPGVVQILNTGTTRGTFGQPSGGSGSGFIIDKQGDIVTNNHVVEGAAKLQVVFADETTVDATVVGADPGNDIAVIKVNVAADKLTVVPMGDSSQVKVGQLAIAIGNPFGYEGTVTTGVISGVDRSQQQSTGRSIRNMIQTDAAINPGNSGGPLLDAQGQVIGINSSIESPTGGSVGIGFAIPINTVKGELNDLMAGRAIEHAWLGITGTKVTADMSTTLDLGVDHGAYVLAVTADGPAAKAGMKGATTDTSTLNSAQDTPKGGDVIIAVDGKSVSSVEEVASYVDSKRPGDSVIVKVMRDKKEMDLNVTLAKWPATARQAAN